MKTRELRKSVKMFIIYLMAVTSLVLICSEPLDDNMWLLVFIITKALAFLVGYGCYTLMERWHINGLLPDDEKDI